MDAITSEYQPNKRRTEQRKSHFGFRVEILLRLPVRVVVDIVFQLESLILAQNQRWRRASYMQVERESNLRVAIRVADG